MTVWGICLLIFGATLAYLKWGTEPLETVAGVFCGLGFGLTIASLGMKKPKLQ